STCMLLPFLILALCGAPAPVEANEAVKQDSEQDAVVTQRPTVHLVVDEPLAQWLVVRLLEDGYPLTGSPDAAHAQLAVVSNAEGRWSVTATGRSSVSYDVEPAIDPAVLRLELLHRSIDALEDVTPVVLAEPQSAAVSLEVSELSPPSLRPQVAAGILAAGATLVPAGTPAVLRVCAEQGEGEERPRISVTEYAGACEVEAGTGLVELGPGVSLVATHLVAAAMAKLDASTDSGAEEAVEPVVEEPGVAEASEPEEESERAPGLEPTPSRIRTPRATAPRVLRGGIAAGFISRGSAVDALVAASMTIGREPGIRGWLELQARPVTVVGPLRVVEVLPAIGFKLRPLTVRRVSLETGLLLGPEIHSYQLQAEQASERGAHVAASLESALGVAVQVWKRHEVHVGLRVGGGMQRIHRVQGQEVWRRGAFRVGMTAGFTFGKGLST
ncbi:MAG: hypothetical protein KUG77_23245, partial [Nannocystaceae bacterium]|nr:hypothetical protein [Nannocystaceae bacterium]